MKTCFKCGVAQPLSRFYKHPRMADGHLNKCIDCTKRDVAENRRKRLGYYRQYDRKRGSRQTAADIRSYRERNPEKARAHRMVSYHVRAGNLTRKPCEQCGAEKTHAHHDDYSRPLDVRWLCASCHAAHHRQHERGL